MILKRTISAQSVILVLLTFIFLFGSVTNADAASKRKKKRSHSKSHSRNYNPKQTRQQAIDIIRSSSEEISELAGLEPKLEDSAKVEIKQAMNDDGEILTTDGDLGENIEELEAEDDVTVDLEEFKMMWLSFIDSNEGSDMTAGGIAKSDLMFIIMEWLGTPYRFGGTTHGNIDCSGFTQKIFLSAADIMLPRVAREQVNVGDKISRKNLEFGDLIFFHTYSKVFASHVGIYLGDDLFAHASSRYGVTVSSLESSYYKNHFIGGRRLGAREMAKYSINSSGSHLNATVNSNDKTINSKK